MLDVDNKIPEGSQKWLYVVPVKDIYYNKNSVFTAHKIYKVKQQTESGYMLINDDGILDYIDESLVRNRYDNYQLALIHNRLFDIGIIILILSIVGVFVLFN
ncbi:hypothetical protein [Paenibacillus glycanilyticus]|uniref:Uncharacterized protein n=1 Tax=Paenibacillus glycanilyticus TaxID=126569 RepID=A0ABQ6G8Q5_9BACL|nr:hypothetical protein [Paenibacillus glycanilyticus]GLX65666.1 hypothetical protein MU1_00100 [Paenibacillus glycanilyticus]